MRIDGIQLQEGSQISNLVVSSGTTFPTDANEGELFFRSDSDIRFKGLYAFIGGNWDRIASSDALTAPIGTTLPTLANTGDLFYRNTNDSTEGLFVYTRGIWARAGDASVSPSTINGDVTGTVTGGQTSTLTLATVVSPAQKGSASKTVNITVNAKGLVTSLTDQDVAIDASQVTTGSFNNLRISAANVTQHQGALFIAETQIADGTIFPRLAGNETITGNWTFNSGLAMSGHIIPSANITYDLGSPTNMWRDLYVGPGSIYMNGKKILEDVSDTIVFTTDDNQNLRIETSGTGNMELQTGSSGALIIKGTMHITSGKKIIDTAGVKVEFGDDIDMSGNRVINVGAPTGANDVVTKSYVDTLTSSDATIVRTSGNQIIAGNKTFTGTTVISGDLTISGNVTTVNTETVTIADNILELNSNFTTGTPTEDSGFQVRRGDFGVARFVWDETNDRFTMRDGQATPNYLDLYTTGTITAGTFAGNASSATKLATPRSISATGDATWTVNFDGTANATGGLTLANIVAQGVYTQVTVDAKGRVTAGTSPTTLAGYGITDAQPLDADLTSIADLATTGLLVRTATATWTNRSVNGTTGRVNVTNGTGVGGNPTIDLATTGSAGTYQTVTTDAYGRVTAGTNAVPWTSLTGTPTTVGGYGITDAYTKTQTDSAISTSATNTQALIPKSSGATGVVQFSNGANGFAGNANLRWDDTTGWLVLGGGTTAYGVAITASKATAGDTSPNRRQLFIMGGDNDAGNGGNVEIYGGNGSTNGGNVSLYSGYTNGTNGNGGNVALQASSGAGTGKGGDIRLTSGGSDVGAANHGKIRLQPGSMDAFVIDGYGAIAVGAGGQVNVGTARQFMMSGGPNAPVSWGSITATDVAGYGSFTDAAFSLTDEADATKVANFQLSGFTTGTTRTFTLPNVSGTVAVTANLTQTFAGVTTFSNATVTIGSSTAASTYGVGSGATISGATKTVNIGTGGVAGSTTNITLGSSAGGGSITVNQAVTSSSTITATGFSGPLAGNASTASMLATARSFSATGDVTAVPVSFNGSGNVALATVLSDTGVGAGTYTKVTVDTKGRVTTGATLIAADIPVLDWSKITTGKPTTLVGYGITDAVNTAQLGAASGVATLDSSGKITATQLPSIAISDTFVVASQAAMLALTAEVGDIAIRTDLNETYILKTAGASTLANWQELLTPTDAVTSVNGMTGAVTISTITGNAGTATTLQTARNFSATGDVTATAVSFNGSANVALATSLSTTGVAAGTYTKVTVDTKGRVTANGGALVAADIPVLDAGKITTGTFTAAQIPSLDAGKITTGTFATALIPSLDAGKITTGSFDTAQIPNLDWAKITTGKPTTLVGYGITDGAKSGANSDITSLSAVTAMTLSQAQLFSGTATVATTTATQVDAFGLAAYRSAKYLVQVVEGTTGFHLVELNLIHNGTTVFMSEYGEVTAGATLGTFDAVVSGANIVLSFTASSATSKTVKFSRTLIKV